MLKDTRKQKGEQQRRYKTNNNKNNKTNKQRKPVHLIKEMNEKIKIIQKENKKRKAVIRTQRWRLRIKLQKPILTNNQHYHRKAPAIIGSNMTEKRKNNKVYYNWPVSLTNNGSVKM